MKLFVSNAHMGQEYIVRCIKSAQFLELQQRNPHLPMGHPRVQVCCSHSHVVLRLEHASRPDHSPAYNQMKNIKWRYVTHNLSSRPGRQEERYVSKHATKFRARLFDRVSLTVRFLLLSFPVGYVQSFHWAK